jgi:hypothetical protein
MFVEDKVLYFIKRLEEFFSAKFSETRSEKGWQTEYLASVGEPTFGVGRIQIVTDRIGLVKGSVEGWLEKEEIITIPSFSFTIRYQKEQSMTVACYYDVDLDKFFCSTCSKEVTKLPWKQHCAPEETMDLKLIEKMKPEDVEMEEQDTKRQVPSELVPYLPVDAFVPDPDRRIPLSKWEKIITNDNDDDKQILFGRHLLTFLTKDELLALMKWSYQPLSSWKKPQIFEGPFMFVYEKAALLRDENQETAILTASEKYLLGIARKIPHTHSDHLKLINFLLWCYQ